MSEKAPTPSALEDESAIDNRLKKRLAVAGALIAVALAAIPVLDSLSGKPSRGEAPAEAGSGRIQGHPARTASAPHAASAPNASAPATLPGTPAGPDTAATPGMAALPKITVVAPAEAPAPAADKTAPAEPAHPPAHKTLPRPDAVTSAARPTVPPTPAVAAPATPTPAAPAARAPAAPAKAKPDGSSTGYALQLGLFASPDNAEKLVSDLKQRGIQARTETRVQLGPFRTRAEADEAMERLKALGYAPMLVPIGQ